MLRLPDTNNVREPLSPEEVALKTLQRAGALGEGYPMGAEVGRLVTTAREEALKQRVDRKKYGDAAPARGVERRGAVRVRVCQSDRASCGHSVWPLLPVGLFGGGGVPCVSLG